MATLTVGSGKSFSTISSAVAASHNGDVIEIQAGNYRNDFATINTNVTLKGVGGMVNLIADASPPNGKAIFVTHADVTLDHLAFSNTKVADNNGCGVRFEGGNLKITNSYFHDNQEGILGSANSGTIAIDHSEFARNGAGDGASHNIYVGGIAQLTVTDSYFHEANLGHEIKSRALATTITGNRIFDLGSDASYSIDLPNGGKNIVTGNIIEQGAHSPNAGIIHFGGEGTPYAGSSLVVSGNTVVNDLASASSGLLYNQSGIAASIHDNHTYGLNSSQISYGPATISNNDALASRPTLDTSSPIDHATTPPIPPATPGYKASVGGNGPQTIDLLISQDAYRGSAAYTLTLDGKRVGGTLGAHASHAQGGDDIITVHGKWAPGSTHHLDVNFLNDLEASGPKGGDRNLHVDGYNLGGVHTDLHLDLLHTGSMGFDFTA